MYGFLIVLQIVIIVSSLFSTILLLRLRGSLDNKFLFVSALCVDMYAIGYLQEMMCSTEEGIRMALAFEYCGLSYAALCFAMFIFKYCHVKKLPKWAPYVMFAFCTFILALVQMGDKTNIYYTSFTVEYNGVFPHMATGKSFTYYAFAAFQATLLGISAAIILKCRSKIERAEERKRTLILFIESLVPLIGLFGTIFIDLGGWDPSPLLLSFLVTSMALTLKRGQFYDAINLAMENMFQNVGNAVIIADNSMNYLDSNQMANSLFPELLNWEAGHDMGDFFINLFSTTEDIYFERDGRYYKSTYTELREKRNLIGYTVTINDTTDMQRQMDDMKRLKDAADAASEAKSAFLANMSHEIRTPLNAIIGMAELSEKERSESVAKEYLSQIKSAGKMLLGIVSDVLDFSKAESGKLELVPVEFDTAEFLNAVINVTNMRIGDKPIDFIVDIDPTIPKTLYADDVHIRQILMNLLSNAEKFTYDGHIKLTLDGVPDGHGLRIKGSVEDTGIGIKPEDQDKLFTAFQQLDAKKNRKIEGSGLGLAIFAQLVQLMQGTYRLESEYGKGSKFYFEIVVDIVNNHPFAEAERETITVQKVSAFSLYGTAKEVKVEEKEDDDSSIVDYSKFNILVVDDNKVNVKVLSAFLKHFKVVADVAYSGPECLEMVKKKKYDLIFMDHMMPDMDGVETTMHIREMDDRFYHKCPIIACTANVVKGVEEVFLQAGMNDFVPKPIQLDILKEKMAKFLG